MSALQACHQQQTGWAKKPDSFFKFVTPAYYDVRKCSIYQQVQFVIRISDVLRNLTEDQDRDCDGGLKAEASWTETRRCRHRSQE